MISEKFDDLARAKPESHNIKEISLAGFMRAKVIRNDDPKMEGRVGCLVPRLMAKFDASASDPTPTNDASAEGMFDSASESKVSGDVPGVNYIWLRPSWYIFAGPKESNIGGSYRVPRKGTWVWCFFEDDDPQKGYYLPLSPSNDGEDISNAKSESPYLQDQARKPNVDVIREYPNQTIIYTDFNEDRNEVVIKTRNNHVVRIADRQDKDGIEVVTSNGNYVIIDDLKDSIFVHANLDLIATVGRHMQATVGGNATADIQGDTTVTTQGHTLIKSMGKVDIHGGSGDLTGVVTKECICPITGSPHSNYSKNVKATKE